MLSTALFRYRWEQCLRVLLQYCNTICNGPFPPTVFWCASASHIIQRLDLPDPKSLPVATEYSSFRLPTLPPSIPASAPKVDEPEDFADLDDDPELQNEVRLLERLEMGPEVADEATNEEKDPSASVPDIKEPNSEFTPSTPASSAVNVASMDITAVSDVEEDSSGPSLPGQQQDEKAIEEKFWNENPRPSDLPSIRTILDTISTPEQSIEQQHPRAIWEEIMKLHLSERTEKVTRCLFVTFESC